MKKAKRALALALVFALVASFCVTGAAAAPGPGNEDSHVINGEAVTQDGVTVSKTARYVDKNEYEITLSVTIPADKITVGSSADIVLVIDTSGSMDYCAECGGNGQHNESCSSYENGYWGWGWVSPVYSNETRLSAAQESATSFVSTLLDGENVNANIGIVSYATNGSQKHALSDDADSLNSAIDDLNADGGTNIQAGIHQARQMLADSDAENKFIVVLSDGEPTYSYAVKGTSGWSGCNDWGRHDWNDGWDGNGQPVNIQLPSAESITEGDFDYTERTGSGNSYSSGVYAILDVTCDEHDETMEYNYSGEDRTFTNNGDPAIAEAGFAKTDGCTIYSIYFGDPSQNAIDTMSGVSSGAGYYQSAANSDALQGIFESIAGEVIETSAGAVEDPMGENIQLGEGAENRPGVNVGGNTLYWNPRNGEVNDNGSTTYTVTYPITVIGEALTKSGWLEANGTTTFTYRVNNEEKTVNFNVPKVWGEKVETEPVGTPQKVYVYVEVVSDDGSELSAEQIAELGLAAVNDHGYYTIGVVSDVTMPDLNTTGTENIIEEYGSGVISKIDAGQIARYAPNAGCDLSKVSWKSLHKVTSGADDYPEVTGSCWHLDGQIKISDIEKVKVTYTSGYGDNTILAEYETIKGAYTPTMAADPTRTGFTFSGWKKVVDGDPSGATLSSEAIESTALTEDTTYEAQWTADEDTAYKVEHYQEQLDRTFVLHETEELTGTTGQEVTAQPKTYEGFTVDYDVTGTVKEGTIAGDGSLVLKLYYVRETYTVTYTDGVDGEEVFENQVTSDIKYGAATPEFDGTPERDGYTFAGWEPEVAETVTETVTYVAQWEEITGTLTVTKTFSGLDALPAGFQITVTGEDYDETFGLDSATPGEGSYTWTIEGLSLGEYTVTETNYAVEGYAHDSANSATSATATLTADTTTAAAALKNVYIKDEPGLSVEKTVHSVNGSTDIPEKVEVDDVIVYKIVVENTGNVALTGISVTDTLGGEPLTVYTDATCETEATAFDLAVDETKELYATYTVEEADAGSTLTNTATAEAEDGTEGSDDVPVEVKKQYTLTVKYYYDEASGEPFKTEEYTLNEGDSWRVSTETGATHVAPGTVEDAEGIQFVLDTELPIASGADGIKTDVVVELVYARDEWEDGTPDYKQAWIVYEVADDSTGMGSVSPESRVVTLTDVADGIYKGTVTAASTATPEDGSVFVEWSWTHDEDGPSTNATLSHEFTAVGGEEYAYTASFRAGTTSASVDKQLVSYERDGETVSEIPEGFKALVGDVLNYEISVKNTGEVALNTTVTDSITGEGTLTINAGEGYTVEDGKIIISGLAPEGTVTITASYTVVAADAGETITNTATADLPGDEPGDDPTGEEEVTVDEYGITVTPADITIYMGGDDGYEAVVGENGQVISDNNTLPTPLFTVELSESFGELSVEQIEAIVIAGTTSDEGMRGWRFDYAGEAEDGTDLYYIVPDAGQEPIRVTYTDGAGIAVVSDHFDPAAIDELFAEFAIELYTGTVTSVTAEVNGITCEIDYSGKGKLTVRAVDDTDENPVVGVQEALPRPVEAGEGAVTAPAGTTYTLNETTVAADAAGVGLLFDGIIDDGADRTGALLAELESELGVTVEDGNYQAQYLDLVDAHNGNAWVKASGAMTVYWGYPEGTGEDTDFALYHFKGLHREGANSGFDIEDVATSDIERVTITKTANGIAFDISSGGFSPFVLVWDDGDGGDEPWWPPIDPGDDDDDGDDGGDGEFVPKWLNIDDHYAYIIGYEDGTVRPQGNITRAEVATIFFRLLTDEVREEYWSTESGYSDVSSSDWYNNAISTLSNLGVITGYEDGTFRPNASISRAEFVTIATRFFDYTAEYEGTFSDVSYSSWYADFVQAAVDMGLVNGYENGTFRPNASITRAEAVAIVNRVLLRRPDADHLLPWSVMNTFSDNVLESAWYYEDIQEATNSHDYEWLKSGVEDWTEKLPERDWAALEREWSSAYDAPGGEVTA